MGTGKTVVGKALADKLGREFVEMDALIVQKAGKSIPEIFSAGGEITFREIEIEVTKEVAGKRNAVIACGGGVVLNKINTDRLKEECIIVYLTASPRVILKRTSGDKNGRPLLNATDRSVTIRELIKFRKPFYERAADIKINTTRLDINSVAVQIISKVKEDESFRLQKRS
jgi:shikimate kinase